MARSVRNIEVAGRRTSFKLEQPFWDGVDRRAQEMGITVNQLVTRVLQGHQGSDATMSSALRVYLIEHFRNQVIAQDRARRAA